MSWGICPPESQSACPLRRCRGTDTHHLYFERREYGTKTEKDFRELEAAKYIGERCVHEAIHASGYHPDKPDRADMITALEQNGANFITEERNRQLAIGRQVLEGVCPLPQEGAA